MPALRVDGGDVLAVYEATRRPSPAPERARAHLHRSRDLPGRPATADDPSLYIDEEHAVVKAENRCVGRYERYLRRLGVLTDEQAAAIRAEALELMRVGIAQAEAEPPMTSPRLRAAYLNPPPTQATDPTSCGGSSGGRSSCSWTR